jgi:hypothetical protein
MFKNAEGQPRFTAAQFALAAIVIAVAIGGAVYRILVNDRLEQTAALFIGLPAILALVLTLTPRAKSTVGITVKGITIALLLSGPLLGEGFICILMAAPLFYAVGIIVALTINAIRRKSGRAGPAAYSVVVLPLLLASLEGVDDRLSFSRAERVDVMRTVLADAGTIETRLAAVPTFDAPLPPFLRLKFPRPVAAYGDGLAVGARRTIHFAGGEGRPGDLILEVVRREPRLVVFRAVRDDSKIAHWLTWKEVEVRWTPRDGRSTTVRWTASYDRELDPAWYFAPWERYAVRRSMEFLSDALLVR